MERGTLYVIASPIGNLDDITIRAVNILKNNIDLVCCEDTRQTRKLLDHYNIKTKRISIHTHTSDLKMERVCSRLIDGENIAYITDSGTPGISDPGSRLVEMVRKKGINITPLPGPSALTALVSVSGFKEKRVIFTGFLSKKPGKLMKELENLRKFRGIIVIYESPHRINKLLGHIDKIFPNSEIIIGREITKMHEEFYTGKIRDIIHKNVNIKEKGEFTLALLNNNEK